MHRLRSNFLLASVFVLAGMSVPVLAAESATTPSPAAEKSLPAIRVTSVKNRILTDRVVVTGSIEAVEEVYVQPQVDGLRIETLKADVGDFIKEGDVVAVLSSDALLLQKSQLEANRAKALAVGAQLEAQLAEVVANAAEAERQAMRAESLVAKGAVARSQAEQLRAAAVAAAARVNSSKQGLTANKADVNVVDAQIRDIDLKLARTEVKSPVSGLVTGRNAKIGAIAAGAGQPLFTVIRDNAIEMNADVAEGELLKLKPGQAVKIALVGGTEPIEGKVRMIDPVVDQTTRLGAVKITIDDAEKARIGMYASAQVIVSEREVLSLPLTAVTAEKGGIYVRRVAGNKVNMAKIAIGVQDGDFIEIAEGLKLNDVVVEKAGAYVRDGDMVQPVASETAQSN